MTGLTGRWRWWAIALGAFALVGAFASLFSFYYTRFHRVTGGARWIWIERKLTTGDPQVVFATRNFDLPKEREFAHLKIAAYPQYTAWFNGVEVGGRSSARPESVDVYDVTALARELNNRLVIGVRSPDGAGALLASVDVSPSLENFVVSSGRWSLFTRWNDQLPLTDPPEAAAPRLVIGRPPAGPWNYLPLRTMPPIKPPPAVRSPGASFHTVSTLPEIRRRDGITIATDRDVAATAFDFGFVNGTVRLDRTEPLRQGTVWIGLANDPGEWHSPPFRSRIVLGEGETAAFLAGTHRFRYVIVYEDKGRPMVADTQ